ncbi:MAG: DUF2795 domain-containing protein [Actinomycetota bacterium]|nr:DUF2795 domain-containing protein [Actinomycetota bacterium]
MDLGNFNPQDLQQYLQNINWPANKDEIVNEAQNNEAPGNIIDQLKNQLDPGQYSDPQQVLSNVMGG